MGGVTWEEDAKLIEKKETWKLKDYNKWQKKGSH